MSDTYVEPEILRRFAGTVDQTSTSISASPLMSHFTVLAACMPGSSTAFVATSANHELTTPVRRLADAYSAMGQSVRVGADEYRARDDDLAAKLDAIEPGSR